MIFNEKKKRTHTHTQQNVGYDFPVNEIFMHNFFELMSAVMCKMFYHCQF